MAGSIKERRESLLRRANAVGLAVRTHAPDGTTIYKFFAKDEVDVAKLDYFSGYGLGRCRGLTEAERWLDGFATGFCRTGTITVVHENAR